MIKNLLKSAAQIFFPHTCVLCSARTHREIDLCVACENDLPIIQYGCSLCGVSLPISQNLCGQCLQHFPCFDKTIVLFSYEEPITKLIIDLKFHHQLIYAKILGLLMARKLNTTALPECIIPVPLHKKRLRERGFNQALEIAKPISKILNIPIDRYSAQRTRETEPQSLTHAKERKKNVKNAFQIKPTFKANHVAIVDDVMTSGHTVNELSQALKKAGVKQIDIWCAARAGK